MPICSMFICITLSHDMTYYDFYAPDLKEGALCRGPGVGVGVH